MLRLIRYAPKYDNDTSRMLHKNKFAHGGLFTVNFEDQLIRQLF